MSNRSIKKLRHRSDTKPMPTFKERMLAGQRGETVCPNPNCRKFTKTLITGIPRCEYCLEVPAELAKVLDERIAKIDSGETQTLSSEEVFNRLRDRAAKRHEESTPLSPSEFGTSEEDISHIHGPECDHDH